MTASRAARLLSACLLLGVLPVGLAQFSYRGEVELATDATLTPSLPAQVGWTLAAHLAASYDTEPADIHLTLDPSVRFGEQVRGEPGLTEAYLSRGFGSLDVSLGFERLPLEYARLSVPYSIEPVNARGVRQGVLGGRVVWYPPGWRLRAATLYLDGPAPLLSVKRNFEGFELELHALYDQRVIAGLGGSGLIGDIVVYGEVWLVTAPLDGRGAMGLSGYLGDRLWTLEAAYAPPQPGMPPLPLLAGQVALVQSADSSLELLAGVGLPDRGAVVMPGLSYTRLTPQGEVNAALGARFGPNATALSLLLSTKAYF